MTQSNPDAQQNEVLHFINYQYLLNDPQSMDVGFLVHQEELTEQEGKKKKTVQRIYAHTFVLADRSPVFKKILSDPIINKEAIVITDICPQTFRSMLNYVYTGDEIANSEDLYGLFYAVNKYNFPVLMKKLEEKLIQTLSIENALTMYEFVNPYHKPEMIQKICSFVENTTMLIVQHHSFSRIQRSTLNFVLSLQRMNVAEIQLFNACIEWARVECARKAIAYPSPMELRNALGQELFLIRFSVMSVKNFMQGPVAIEIFDKKEQNELMNSIMGLFQPYASSGFAFLFNSNERQHCSFELSPYFDEKFKFSPSNYSAMEVTSTLQFNASSDVLLMGFRFGPILGSFTISSVALFQDWSPVFANEKVSCTKDTQNLDFFSVQFYTPLLISAGLTYKLTLCLEFDEMQTFCHTIEREPFTITYERPFSEKNPISIEIVNKTRCLIRITQFYIY